MPPSPPPPPPRSVSPWLAAAAALASAATLVAIDLSTPVDLLVPILYSVSLAFAAFTRDRRLLLGLAIVLEALTIGFHFAEPPPAVAQSEPIVLLNRGMTAVMLLTVTAALYLWIGAEAAIDHQRSVLEQGNRELEAINEELGQREEEIVRQNEELQSQTEELERQSDELRVANEELAAREKLLNQLLELSRSLTAELSREQMLGKICEALGVLTQGLPAAVCERRGEMVRVICHHGFGPDGLAAEQLPYATSFVALVASVGQTAYLEDTRLRPDLHFPAPKGGEPFRAVLSTPLRVHGQCIGTVDVYARERHAWTEPQITMVESLAAQASISLQSVDLVETIRQERRRFEAAFRTAPFGLVVANDATGTEAQMNPAAAATFGLPLDENVSPRSPAGARLRRSLFGPDGPLPEGRWPLVRALAGEESQGEEIDLVLPGGRRYYLLSGAAPVLDRNGEVAGAVWAFADITAQKQLQREQELRRREAEEASVRKTRFLASVSHDIRTPVNAINLMAEVIRRAVDNPALAPQIPHLAQRLQANALSLVELVTDVLDIARIDTGKVEIIETEFVLNELLADEVRQLQPLAADKGLSLEVEPPARPIWLRADRVKLARILGNLISNAIKFTDHGTVRVSAALGAERQVVIRVADTGHGIAAEHQGYIFDEFAQLRNPARSRDQGTGLGLAICKRLVEVMGGAVAVESTPQVGSTFTVTLPATCVVLRLDGASAVPSEPQGPAAAGANVLRGLRILLVEDHPVTRETTAQILRDEGAEVVEAADGRSGLDELRCERTEVLLLDMMLPDMDGRELLRNVRDRCPAGLRAIIVMTGDVTPERLDEVRRLGADALIEKPIDVTRLIGILQQLRKT